MKSKTFFRSKSKQNLINYKKANLLLKYSNTTLFERRELEFLQNKKSEKNFNTKTFYNTFNNNKQINNSKTQTKLIKKSDSIPLLLNSLSSFQTSLTTNIINKNEKNTEKKNLKKFPTFVYTPRRKTPQLCLSESELLNNNILYSSEEEKALEKEKLKIKKEFKKRVASDKFIPKTPDYKDRKKEDKNSIGLLLYIERELNKYREKKKDDKNIDLKIKDLNKKEYGTKKLIKKTRKYKYLQYMSSFKNQRAELIDEEYQANIENIQEKINSLQRALQLFNVKFINKLADYVKFIISIRDEEKSKNITLFKLKTELQKKLGQMNSEIEKLQFKKNRIIKWVYLQIKVKEKKLILPNYYEKIIECNNSQIMILRSKLCENLNERKKVKAESFQKKKILFRKNSLSPFNNDRNFHFLSKKLSSNNLSIKTNKDIMSEEKENKVKINIGKENITENEFDKILIYKKFPIFKTSEEFNDRLKDLDNQNLLLLKYYNQLQSKIYDYQKILLKMMDSKDKSEIIDKQIKTKTNELDILKKKYTLISKTYLRIKEDISNSKKRLTNASPLSLRASNNILVNNNINTSKNRNKNKKMDKIYSKINELFDNCKIVNNEKLTELLYYNIKKTETKEDEIIFIFEYIECTVDYLLGRVRYYKREENKNELLQQLLIEIDKKHKKEKPDKQKIQNLEKNLDLITRLENKNNKIFLRSKRLDLFHYNMKNKKRINKGDDKNKDDFPTIEDFMKNANIINDVYSDELYLYMNDNINNKRFTKKRKSIIKKKEKSK